MTTEPCVGCGARVPAIRGPVHRYMTAAPGCWAAFGALSARLAASSELGPARQYCVDAYAVQHPGTPNPQAIQSVAVHLLSLYAYLERGEPVVAAPALLQRSARAKGAYRWLPPPSFAASRTIDDVHLTDDVAALTASARAWAHSAWMAWHRHHAQVARWYELHAGRAR